MKRASLFLLAFLIVMLFLPLYQTPQVKAQEPSGSFGNPQVTLYNWTKFWQLFNAHSAWDLEYNNGSGWISDKSQLQIIKNYTRRVSNENDTLVFMPTNKTEADSCKITLNFTAKYTADYRLTFGIDIDVKNYTHKESSWNYTLTYQNHTVFFDWSDIKDLPLDNIQHGVKPVGDDTYFWFRIRKNDIQEGKNFVIDPSFGKTDTGSIVQAFKDYLMGSVFTIAEDGTANNMTFYGKLAGANRKAKLAIYKHSDSTLVGNTTERTDLPDNVYGYYTFDFPDPEPSLVASTDYVLIAWATADTQAYIMRDDGDTDQGHYQSLTYNGFPDPATFSHQDRVHCIFANYTVSGPSEFSEEFTETIGISASLSLWNALFSIHTETVTVTSTSYLWREYPCFFTETTTITEQLNQWNELRRFFTETITPTEQMNTYRALFRLFQETISPTETSSFTMELALLITEFTETVRPDISLLLWDEKQFFVYETITLTASLQALAEQFISFIEYSELIQFDASMYLTLPIVPPTEVDVTTFGTVAFIIAIIALAIAVTALTAKKK